MTREQVIQGYLMNSPEVVAEMLYDTIERYENRSCEGCEYVNNEFAPCIECSRFYLDNYEESKC